MLFARSIDSMRTRMLTSRIMPPAGFAPSFARPATNAPSTGVGFVPGGQRLTTSSSLYWARTLSPTAI